MNQPSPQAKHPIYKLPKGYHLVTKEDLVGEAEIIQISIGGNQRRNRSRTEDPATYGRKIKLEKEPVRHNYVHFQFLDNSLNAAKPIDQVLRHDDKNFVYIVQDAIEPTETDETN